MNPPNTIGAPEACKTPHARMAWPRFSLVGTVLLALVAGLAASSLMPPEPAARAAIPISKTMRASIDAMSTGEDQQLVVRGDTALARNAQLPFAKMSGARMSAVAGILPSAPGYAAALKCLTQAIYYEAANEPELGKRSVAQVVLNRLRHPAYPDSVCGVVYEGANAPVCQFSFTCDGSLQRAPMARQWAQSRAVAERALAGDVVADVGSATHYHADYVLPRWAFTLGKLNQIGRHIFYRFPGRLGNAPAFTDRWTGVERIPALDFSRLRLRLAARDEAVPRSEVDFVPGLTVPPDIKDRHAALDVGGRLDTTTSWRLSIPEATQLSANYRSLVAGQDEAARQPLAGSTQASAQ